MFDPASHGKCDASSYVEEMLSSLPIETYKYEMRTTQGGTGGCPTAKNAVVGAEPYQH